MKVEISKANETLKMIIKEKEIAIEKSLFNTTSTDEKFLALKSQFEDKNL